MKTQIFTRRDDPAPAAEILRAGGFCAVPTETVYGLCVNGLDPNAVAALYELKGRPEINHPLCRPRRRRDRRLALSGPPDDS